MFPLIICQIKTCPRMTHHMLSTLKPLIDVMAPGGTLVSNIQLVFFIREKHWKNFLTFTPKPEITHFNKLFVIVSHWRNRASLTEEQFLRSGKCQRSKQRCQDFCWIRSNTIHNHLFCSETLCTYELCNRNRFRSKRVLILNFHFHLILIK